MEDCWFEEIPLPVPTKVTKVYSVFQSDIYFLGSSLCWPLPINSSKVVPFKKEPTAPMLWWVNSYYPDMLSIGFADRNLGLSGLLLCWMHCLRRTTFHTLLTFIKLLSLLYFTLLVYYYVGDIKRGCVCVCMYSCACIHSCVMVHVWRLKATLWSRFSPSTFMWVLGIQLRSRVLVSVLRGTEVMGWMTNYIYYI